MTGVSGLLGFLVTSAVFAVVGTVIRGLIRPISWATLALSIAFTISDQVLNAFNSDTNSAVEIAQNSPTTSDEAVPGWAEVAETLESILDTALQPPAPPPRRSPSPSPTPRTPPRSPTPIQGYW